jgi:integrase
MIIERDVPNSMRLLQLTAYSYPSKSTVVHKPVVNTGFFLVCRLSLYRHIHLSPASMRGTLADRCLNLSLISTAMPLTDRTIQAKAKPAERPFKLFDGHGLFLLVKPNGGRYWRMQYRFMGKAKGLAFGVYPFVTLREARDKRDDARKQIRNGIDPSMLKRERKQQAKGQAADSFENIAREWHSKQQGRWSAVYSASVLRVLEREVFSHIGGQLVQDLTAPAILTVVRRIEARNALTVAARVLQWISSVFRYAIRTSRAVYNPAADLAGSIRTRKTTHRAALSRAELPEFLARVNAYQGHAITRLALKLLTLTFVRSNELRGARWDEFDLARDEWRIPAVRMKMNAEHIVPLSHQALAILDELHPLTGRYDLLFPNQSDPSQPMSKNTLLYAMYRLGYHQRVTVHGLRATAATILSEMDFRPDIIERQLSHSERNQTRAAYQRSQYLEERRRMMAAWADYLEGLGGKP